MSINYEERIEELGKRITTMDPNTSACKTERLKFMDYAYNYVSSGRYYAKLARKRAYYFGQDTLYGESLAKWNGLQTYGQEIMETCNDVLKSYTPDPEKGSFLAYFNTSMYNRLNKAIGSEVYRELHGGLTTAKGKAKGIARIIKELQKDDLETSVNNVLLRGAEYETGITREDVVEYLGTSVDIDKRLDPDQTASDYIDAHLRRSSVILDENYVDPQESVAAKDSAEYAVWVIENGIDELQEYRKPYVSDCMTSILSRWLGFYEYRLEEARMTKWFSEEVFGFYAENGEPMPMNQIALKYGKSPSSISRSFQSFLSHIIDDGLYEIMYDSVVRVKK